MMYLLGKHPFLTVKVKLPSGKWIIVECLIDTGFSGGLVLPEKFKRKFSSDEFIEAHFVLANGLEVAADATYTTVRYDRNNNEKEAAVVFMGASDSLVGVEFLDNMRFCLDLKKNKVELTT